MGKDYYALLGTTKDADEKAIKKAYKKQAMKWHPDKNPDKLEEAELKFKEIAEAYDVLSDDKKRKIYDQFGEEGLKQGGPGGGGGFPGGMPGGFTYEFRGDPHDIFTKMFGGGGGFGGFGGFDDDFMSGMGGGGMGGGGMGGMPFFMGGMPGGMGGMMGQQPFLADLKLTLEELYSGVTKKLKITRKSVTPGRATEHTFEIKVQPGWKAGTKLTFKGEGDEARKGQAQDVVFVVKEKPHAVFRRDGSDLVISRTVALRDALAGFKFSVQGLDGETIPVEVRDVVQPNATKVVPGKGMPKRKEPGQRGDLIVSFQVVFPRTLPQDVKTKLRELLPSGR